VEICNARQVDVWYHDRRPHLIEGKEPVLIVETMPGASIASSTLEELHICGIEKVLYAGYAGSLTKDLIIGDIVVVNSIELIEADQELMHLGMEKLKATNIKHHFGRIRTTDTSYMETP